MGVTFGYLRSRFIARHRPLNLFCIRAMPIDLDSPDWDPSPSALEELQSDPYTVPPPKLEQPAMLEVKSESVKEEPKESTYHSPHIVPTTTATTLQPSSSPPPKTPPFPAPAPPTHVPPHGTRTARSATGASHAPPPPHPAPTHRHTQVRIPRPRQNGRITPFHFSNDILCYLDPSLTSTTPPCPAPPPAFPPHGIPPPPHPAPPALFPPLPPLPELPLTDQQANQLTTAILRIARRVAAAAATNMLTDNEP